MRRRGRTPRVLTAVIALLATPLFASGAHAAADEERIDQLERQIEDLSGEVQELKRQRAAEEQEEASRRERAGEAEGDERVDVLARELDRLKRAVAVPEDEELRSVWGLAPAASKVYLRDRGLSIGSYGEVFASFAADEDGTNVADTLRAVLYLGYKFNDWIVVNTELEFEHAGAEGANDVGVEFLTLDFLGRDEVNARAGLVLAPMGLVNEIHEPVFFYGVQRPTPEQRIIPTTWSEVGGGLFGNLLDDRLHYRAYTMVSFDATGFSSDGLRGGRQKGSESRAEDWAGVARLDWTTPLPGLQLGGSVFTGATGQSRNVGGMDVPDAWTTLYELHGIYSGYNATVRALWTQAFVNEAGDLSRVLGLAPNAAVASRSEGGYATLAYNVLPHFLPDSEMTLEPFFRFEYVNTQAEVPTGFAPDRSKDAYVWIPGLQFKPHPQVVLKLDYRREDPRQGETTNAVEIGFGYVF